MGCASSSKKDGDYYNKDIDEKRKLLTGFHMSRGQDGIETISRLHYGESLKSIMKKEEPEEEK